MALRTVVVEGDEVLRKVCKPVKEVTPRIKETLEDMVDTMRDAFGVGLAAPQVGIMRRMFVAEPYPDEEEKIVYYMINPEIIEMSENMVEGEEGCLSVPGYVGKVKRAEYIKMKALDLDGVEQEYEFYDFEARVMQHEYDHLDGVLYTDKAVDVHIPSYPEDDEEIEEETVEIEE